MSTSKIFDSSFKSGGHKKIKYYFNRPIVLNAGIEPASYAWEACPVDSFAVLRGSHSIHPKKFFVRVARIELASQAWEARVLPLY